MPAGYSVTRQVMLNSIERYWLPAYGGPALAVAAAALAIALWLWRRRRARPIRTRP